MGWTFFETSRPTIFVVEFENENFDLIESYDEALKGNGASIIEKTKSGN